MLRILARVICLLLLGVVPTFAEGFNVVCTTGMIGDLVRGVVRDTANVDVLMGPGVDPHLYKPTRSDIARLGNADLVFYNGLLLEGKMTDALLRVSRSGKMTVAVSEKLSKAALIEPESFSGHYDPHIWMDPFLWIEALDVVSETLIRFKPEMQEVFRQNMIDYRVQLVELADYATHATASVPKAQRILVTAHDAFNYFGKRFGFSVQGIQGLSTESEAGVRHIEELVALLVREKIQAVFVESTVPSRSVYALIEGAAQRGQQVKVGGELFSDAMGNAGSYEGTYLGMIDHNVTTIVRALGGTTPPRGSKGKLMAHE